MSRCCKNQAETMQAKLLQMDPLRRDLLSRQGTLQEALATYFKEPIDVRVTRQRVAPETNPIAREVTLVRRLNDIIVCRARTEIHVQDEKARQLILEERLGLGQIFQTLQLQATFTLEEIDENSDSFWRIYLLEAPGIACRIREEFPTKLF